MSKFKLLKLISITILILAGNSTLAAAGETPAPKSDCVKVRIAVDIGSGSTRVRSAVVNTCTQLLITTVAKTQTPIAFKEHLATQSAEPKTFSSEFMNKAVSEIKESVTKIETETQQKLKTDPALKAYAKLAATQIEVAGVATEGFRQASNNGELIARLTKEKINIHLISQTDEGHLGFIGAQSALGTARGKASDPQKIISWDIGGGSLQIVGYKKPPNGKNTEAPWLDYGNKLASIPTRIFILEKFKKLPALDKDKKPNSPNPLISTSLSAKETQEVTTQLKKMVDDFAKPQIQDFQQLAWWQSPKLKFYGIGGVHNGILSTLRFLKGHEQATGYTPADLDQLLAETLFSDDSKLAKDYNIPPAFTSGAVTNILLVQSLMKSLKISHLEVLDVDNTLAVLIAPAYWH